MEDSGLVTLSKFLADAGACARRQAAQEIKSGNVQVNGKVITDPAYKVSEFDKILFHKKPVVQHSKVYILLNKPEGYVTTVSDEQDRNTVMDLIKDRSLKGKRLYPVGRLDINTTGLLVITNDGELAQKLTHPKFGASKTYQVTLDQPMEHNDFIYISKGLKLEDGFIKPDRIYYPKSGSYRKLVIEIHSGKNRIIRRIFKAVGYNVIKLERVGYAGLDKKGLPEGSWRFLSQKDIDTLKNFEIKKDLDSEHIEKPKRYSKPASSRFGKRNYEPRPSRDGGFKKPYKKRDDFDSSTQERPARKSYFKRDEESRPSRDGAFKRPYKKRDDFDSSTQERPARKSYFKRDEESRPSRDGGFKKPYKKRDDFDSSTQERPARKSYFKRDDDSRPSRDGAFKRPYKKRDDFDSSTQERPARKSYFKRDEEARPSRDGGFKKRSSQRPKSEPADFEETGSWVNVEPKRRKNSSYNRSKNYGIGSGKFNNQKPKKNKKSGDK